jgi:hypothetical protein
VGPGSLAVEMGDADIVQLSRPLHERPEQDLGGGGGALDVDLITGLDPGDGFRGGHDTHGVSLCATRGGTSVRMTRRSGPDRPDATRPARRASSQPVPVANELPALNIDGRQTVWNDVAIRASMAEVRGAKARGAESPQVAADSATGVSANAGPVPRLSAGVP